MLAHVVTPSLQQFTIKPSLFEKQSSRSWRTRLTSMQHRWRLALLIHPTNRYKQADVEEDVKGQR